MDPFTKGKGRQLKYEEPILYEAGVNYARATRQQDIPKGMVSVPYYWKHHKTGRTGTSYVQVFDERSLYRLLEHWNGYGRTVSQEWTYSSLPFAK